GRLHAGADRLVRRDRHRLLDRRAAVPGDLLLDPAALLAAGREVLPGLRRCRRADAAGGGLAREGRGADDHAHRADGRREPGDHPAGRDRVGVRRRRRGGGALVRLPGGAVRAAGALRPGDRRLLEQYLSHLRIERGLSPHTLAAYERDLRRYLLELSRQDVDPAAVDPQQLGTWLQTLRTGADGGSVLSAASAARSLA